MLPPATSTPTASLAVSGFPATTTAGTAGNFTVIAQNADGTTNIGYTGTVHLSSTDAQAVLPPDYPFTAADNGTHTFSVTLETAGFQSITATDTRTATITGAQAGIRVVPLASITGPSAGALNQTLTYTLGASGDPAGTVYTFNIDWNGDGIV